MLYYRRPRAFGGCLGETTGDWLRDDICDLTKMYRCPPVPVTDYFLKVYPRCQKEWYSEWDSMILAVRTNHSPNPKLAGCPPRDTGIIFWLREDGFDEQPKAVPH